MSKAKKSIPVAPEKPARNYQGIRNPTLAYQAIETQYHGPTNSRGARVSATAQAGRIYVSWDHALGVEENHATAAAAYIAKMGWQGEWTGGGRASGNGNVYVNTPGTRK